MTVTQNAQSASALRFSAIAVADLAGLRKILPHDLDSSGPHLVGHLKDHAAFMALDKPVSGDTGNKRIAQGHFYPWQSPALSAWNKGTELPLSSHYPLRIGRDILALDQALGFSHATDEKWGFAHDQTQVSTDIRQRIGWHQDNDCSRIYLVAIPNGTVMLKDSAPDGLKKDMSDASDRAKRFVEALARRRGFVVDAEPGSIYLISGKTWHSSPGVKDMTAVASGKPTSSGQSPLRDRTFMTLFAENPRRILG